MLMSRAMEADSKLPNPSDAGVVARQRRNWAHETGITGGQQAETVACATGHRAVRALT